MSIIIAFLIGYYIGFYVVRYAQKRKREREIIEQMNYIPLENEKDIFGN